MCLAVPMRVIEINNHLAKVDSSGVQMEVDISLVPEVKVNDYVIVHAGFAIEVLKEEDALETLSLIREMVEKEDLF